MVLLITYDLHNPGRDYESVKKLIQSAKSSTHPMGSVWFIDTASGVAEWRDALSKAGDANDEYFVSRVRSDQWASWNLDRSTVAWLSSPARAW